MKKEWARAIKEFSKLIQARTAVIHLENGETIQGDVIAIDKNLRNLIVEKPNGQLALIPEHSFSYIETLGDESEGVSEWDDKDMEHEVLEEEV